MIRSIRFGSIIEGESTFRNMWLPAMVFSRPFTRTSLMPISSAFSASTSAFSAEG